ncbi:hypothetical protein ACFX58_04415 [Sphingomonas sp. NCPPB 2930]
MIRKGEKKEPPPQLAALDQALNDALGLHSSIDVLTETDKWLDLHKLFRPLNVRHEQRKVVKYNHLVANMIVRKTAGWGRVRSIARPAELKVECRFSLEPTRPPSRLRSGREPKRESPPKEPDNYTLLEGLDLVDLI